MSLPSFPLPLFPLSLLPPVPQPPLPHFCLDSFFGSAILCLILTHPGLLGQTPSGGGSDTHLLGHKDVKNTIPSIPPLAGLSARIYTPA
jgi:hypothetical protein